MQTPILDAVNKISECQTFRSKDEDGRFAKYISSNSSERLKYIIPTVVTIFGVVVLRPESIKGVAFGTSLVVASFLSSKLVKDESKCGLENIELIKVVTSDPFYMKVIAVVADLTALKITSYIGKKGIEVILSSATKMESSQILLVAQGVSAIFNACLFAYLYKSYFKNSNFSLVKRGVNTFALIVILEKYGLAAMASTSLTQQVVLGMLLAYTKFSYYEELINFKPHNRAGADS